MPLYTFVNPKTKKTKDVFFHMNDDKIYIEDGVEWTRVYHSPQATVKNPINPNNSKEFAHVTGKMKGNVGDIHNLSEELSNKRASESEDGRDPIKDSYLDKWSEKRGGRSHSQDDRPKPKKVKKVNKKK